jgi:hypothetical protein
MADGADCTNGTRDAERDVVKSRLRWLPHGGLQNDRSPQSDRRRRGAMLQLKAPRSPASAQLA